MVELRLAISRKIELTVTFIENKNVTKDAWEADLNWFEEYMPVGVESDFLFEDPGLKNEEGLLWKYHFLPG